MNKNRANDPYSPPKSKTLLAPEDPSEFSNVSFDELKKLYYRSCNLNGIRRYCSDWDWCSSELC